MVKTHSSIKKAKKTVELISNRGNELINLDILKQKHHRKI